MFYFLLTLRGFVALQGFITLHGFCALLEYFDLDLLDFLDLLDALIFFVLRCPLVRLVTLLCIPGLL